MSTTRWATRLVSNAYDAKDNLTSTTNISGTTTFAYNARGLLTSVTDANGHTTQYAYNANGDRTSTTDPSGKFVPIIAAAIGVPIAVGAITESVALSILFAPLKPGLLNSGLEGFLPGLQKGLLGAILGQSIDDWLYGDGQVPNPYFSPWREYSFFGGGSSRGHGASGSWGDPPSQGK